MKLYVNNKFLDLKDDKIIKKLDYYFSDRNFMIKKFKEELQKIESLESNVKNALDNIEEIQKLSLEKIKLLEKMKHSILHKYDINIRQFRFRNY